MKRIILISMFVATNLLAATNATTFVEKFFTVSNANPNATGPLVGTATMVNTNSPFYIPTNISFSVMGTQYYNAYIRLNTSKTGKYTNWVLFSSNGGNSTNMVYGTVLPGGIGNFKFK